MRKIKLDGVVSALQDLAKFIESSGQLGLDMVQRLNESQSYRDYMLNCNKQWPIYMFQKMLKKANKKGLLITGIRQVKLFTPLRLPIDQIYRIDRLRARSKRLIKTRGARQVPLEKKNWQNIARVQIEIPALKEVSLNKTDLILLIQFDERGWYNWDLFRLEMVGNVESMIIWRNGCADDWTTANYIEQALSQAVETEAVYKDKL